MRIQHIFTAAALAAFAAAPAGAQSVKKVGSEVHHALKKTGREIKEVGGEVGSATHKTLSKAGKDTKDELKRSTGGGVKIGGDVGKVARNVSKESKRVGRKSKKALKSGSSATHKDLTKAGKEAKETVKP